MDQGTLNRALSRLLGEEVVSASYETAQLKGGTVGDVRLVTGTAVTACGESRPYKLVRKTQKKWLRYGDPASWRREYDLYVSALGECFGDGLRWPTCYHAEDRGDETEIWMEYVEGVSGSALTVAMCARAAEEWGRFQGKLYATRPDALQTIDNLGALAYARNFYEHYRSWPEVYDEIRSDAGVLPRHLRDLLIDFDDRAEDALRRIEKLPIVLCHRDFWVENLIDARGRTVLLDWDTAGWGYLGEDIASLVADEADPELMVDLYRQCVPAYYRGFAQYADGLSLSDHCVLDFVLMLFGYRLVESWKFADTDEEKARALLTLQRIYDMRDVVF